MWDELCTCYFCRNIVDCSELVEIRTTWINDQLKEVGDVLLACPECAKSDALKMDALSDEPPDFGIPCLLPIEGKPNEFSINPEYIKKLKGE